MGQSGSSLLDAKATLTDPRPVHDGIEGFGGWRQGLDRGRSWTMLFMFK